MKKSKIPARQGSWKCWEISPWDKGEERHSEDTADDLEELQSLESEQN